MASRGVNISQVEEGRGMEGACFAYEAHIPSLARGGGGGKVCSRHGVALRFGLGLRWERLWT